MLPFLVVLLWQKVVKVLQICIRGIKRMVDEQAGCPPDGPGTLPGSGLNRRGQMAGRAAQIRATPVGEITAHGDADFDCQQRSELKPVKGFDIVGLLAPLLVLTGRLLQGFSAGVELGGVSVYLSEMATPGRCGGVQPGRDVPGLPRHRQGTRPGPAGMMARTPIGKRTCRLPFHQHATGSTRAARPKPPSGRNIRRNLPRNHGTGALPSMSAAAMDSTPACLRRTPTA